MRDPRGLGERHGRASRIREWEAGGHQVYAYFNNDGGGNAVRDARALRAALA
ncbi:hypothetical protein GCM10009724_12420 [Microbacterium lacticum]|nr:hypothetical protein MLA01_11370 [Microbacterium lacticum]GGN19867.1 hypothetical protein GCM10009724_12420 [Microbacterium lacticum]